MPTWIRGAALAGGLAAALLAGAARAEPASGEWHGLLSVGQAGALHLGLTLADDGKGGLTGRLASPDQGANNIPIANAVSDGASLSFDVPAVKGRYEGHWDVARHVWTGTWSQGQPLALDFEAGPVTPPERPQVPRPPFPYAAEDVTVQSAPGVTLACTLTRPAGQGPFPGVVLITGSGPQDRDEALMGHQPFLVLADHLSRRGIAVLRCDDRGFGRSTGVFGAATSRDFAIDAEASAAFLRGRPGIDPARVGLIGHSEGGLIAPMVAGQDPKIAFIVLLAGPGVPSRALMTAQRAAVGRSVGLSADRIEKNEALVGPIDDIAMRATSQAAAQSQIEALLLAQQPAPAAAVAKAQARYLASDWYRNFIAYDPRPALQSLRIPVLALNGDKDTQVVSSQNIPALRAALKDDPHATVTELPGLNHLFQTAGTGSPLEYATITETMSPTVLNIVSDWINGLRKR
ncbi:alpha/beta hydrolase family protein [Caulobacter sp. KR2-114]|uniref:alpha/beta hydrolase family protein n=1 Tax=Caulobacter sp. KR2-114 TaxID=3400912 RepID=UPI003C0C5B53